MNKRPFKWLLLAAIAVACIFVTVSTRNSHSDSLLMRVQRDGVLRIGYAIEAPYAFLDAEGVSTGLDIEVAKRIAARLSIPRLEWCQTSFGSLIQELESGRFDVIVAGLFITPERAKRIRYSEPTFHVRQAMLVQKGNPLALHAYEDVLAKPQARVAVMQGSIEQDIVSRLGVPAEQVLVVPDALTGRLAVETGLAACLALSSPTVDYMARQQSLGLTEIAAPFTQPEAGRVANVGYGAVAFRKSDEDFCRAWNLQLKEFIGGAEHKELLNKFGLNEDVLPGTVSTASLLPDVKP